VRRAAKLKTLCICKALHKRKSWLFAGSDRGGERAAAMYSLVVTARLNSIDPRAWLADVLDRIADHPASRLHELLPWYWDKSQPAARAA
jgi:transposase